MEWLVPLLLVSIILNLILIAIVAPVARAWWRLAAAELEAYAHRDLASRTDEGV